MSEGLRRPEGLPSWTKVPRAPGPGPHPLLAAFAALGWRPSNGVVRWLCAMPRDTTVEHAIKQIHPSWTETLTDLGDALRSCRPVPWSLLALLPSWVAHNTPPVPEKHPGGRRGCRRGWSLGGSEGWEC